MGMPKNNKIIGPKEIITKKVFKLKSDTFAYIWLAFIAVLVLMTYFFKPYVKGMIVISILFVIFWFLEPFLLGTPGSKVSTYLSNGQRVPGWKRFPLFFLVIILLYLIYTGVQYGLELAFPEESVNIVFVALWVGFLFLLWHYKFSKE
jgi:hypothetical protein